MKRDDRKKLISEKNREIHNMHFRLIEMIRGKENFLGNINMIRPIIKNRPELNENRFF